MINGIIIFEIYLKVWNWNESVSYNIWYFDFFFYFYLGIFIGSIYNDKVLKIMGFLGENI